jgi:hypothetical protein
MRFEMIDHHSGGSSHGGGGRYSHAGGGRYYRGIITTTDITTVAGRSSLGFRFRYRDFNRLKMAIPLYWSLRNMTG